MNFDTLFRYHYRPLCLYAIHYVHDIDAAEDVVQECFSVLWEKTEQEGGEIANVRSYLYTMVRNRSLDWLKQNSMFDTTLSPSDLEDRLPEEEVYGYGGTYLDCHRFVARPLQGSVSAEQTGWHEV